MNPVVQENELLSNEEIEAILAEESAQVQESHAPVPLHHLAESTSNAAPWVKWLLLIALGSEFMLGMVKLFSP